MIFTRLTLTNLYSYYGTCEFDLEPTGKGNILLIMGRNGHGKTSFINSVKLLFIGPDEILRRQVTTNKDRIPSVNQYVCGGQGFWGIMNHQAAKAGDNTCSVRLEWKDEQNQIVIAERQWILHGGNRFDELLSVNAYLEGELDGDRAQTYLDNHLPKDFIPFFFFDGEEVRELAESNNNKTIAKMERLLNIRPIENLQEGLKALRKRWRETAADSQRKEELVKTENKRDELNAALERITQQQLDHKLELQETEQVLDRTNRQIEVLRGSTTTSGENTGELRGGLEQQESQQAELWQQLSNAFMHDAFLRLAPKHMDKAIQMLEQRAHSEAVQQTELLTELQEHLSQLFTSPPYPKPQLTEQQASFYQQRIDNQLNEYKMLSSDSAGILELNSAKAQSLLKQLTIYTSNQKPASALLQQTNKLHELNRTLEQQKKRLDGAQKLSNERQEELNQLLIKQQIQQESLYDLKDKLRSLEKEQSTTQREYTEVASQVERLKQEVEKASQARGKFDLAQRIIQMLEAIKGKLREQKRGELQEYYNNDLTKLLDSNHLLHKVEVDDEFLIHYKNSAGESVPKEMISAGMKQLSATALLWALKTASNKQIPLLVDTPLGRIDRQHQDNLLQYYYPNASEQVILLATDSELDSTKHDLLKPHIYREYGLHNPSGEMTEISLEELSDG